MSEDVFSLRISLMVSNDDARAVGDVFSGGNEVDEGWEKRDGVLRRRRMVRALCLVAKESAGAGGEVGRPDQPLLPSVSGGL